MRSYFYIMISYRCIRGKSQHPSTSRWDASGCCGTLPRPEKQSTGLFFTLASLRPGFRVPPHIPKKRTPLGVLFFGARDGTRTHTAVATRTSNVIVYHSNTLAKPDYYNQQIPICQYLFGKILAILHFLW